MKTTTISLPAMYGDHHVQEVRRLLLEIPGVEDVYASSSFRIAEVTLDPAQTSLEVLEAALDRAGYLGELLLPQESDIPVNERNSNGSHFRHTTAFAQVKQTVSFGQTVANSGRPLWPCPGMGPDRSMDE